MANGDLLVGVVESDGEAGWEKGLGRRGGAAVLADDVCGERGLRPFGDDQDLAVDDVRHVGVIEGDGVAVLGGARRRVWVAQSVGGFGLVAVLAEVDGPEVFGAGVGGFEEEGYSSWLASWGKVVQ